MFSDLLNETKGFKYQITIKVLLKKYKHNREIEFAPVSFNSLTTTVINHTFWLKKPFQNILYMFDVWINKESCWNVESIESQYINISTYRPLSGSFIHELTCWIKKSKKRANPSKTKIKNVFYGVMLNILILQKNIQKELKKLTKKLLKNLIMMELSFPCKKKILAKLKWKTIYALTCLVMKMGWFFQFMDLWTHWICCF